MELGDQFESEKKERGASLYKILTIDVKQVSGLYQQTTIRRSVHGISTIVA
jgi:hypothetical protein